MSAARASATDQKQMVGDPVGRISCFSCFIFHGSCMLRCFEQMGRSLFFSISGGERDSFSRRLLYTSLGIT